jgi:hypothetical protein
MGYGISCCGDGLIGGGVLFTGGVTESSEGEDDKAEAPTEDTAIGSRFGSTAVVLIACRFGFLRLKPEASPLKLKSIADRSGGSNFVLIVFALAGPPRLRADLPIDTGSLLS